MYSSKDKRPDRDDFVTVLEDHLENDCKSEFEKMQVFSSNHNSTGEIQNRLPY